MKNIITKTAFEKTAKMNPASKKRFIKYWSLIYGPLYAKEMSKENYQKPGKK